MRMHTRTPTDLEAHTNVPTSTPTLTYIQRIRINNYVYNVGTYE